MRPDARTLCPGLLLAVLAIAGSAAAQDRAPASAAEAAAPAAPPAAAPAVQPAAAPAAQQAKPPDGFRVGDFTFKPGGRIKLDIIRDFKPIDNEDSFDTRTIPIDADDRTNSNLIAKETRLFLDIRGNVDDHELKMYIEGDFYGTSSAFRLRHAYGTYKGLLAGQTWSTFVDEDNLPRTIDFEAPTAFAQIRQAQLRYTFKFGGGVSWALAVEDNKSSIILPADIPGRAEFPSPDFATRVRFDFPRGHISAAAFTGAARFRADDLPDTDNRDDPDPDTVTLWGTALSANFKTIGRDTIYGVVTYGDGIGRYRGGITAVPDENGNLHAAQAFAFMGGYEHFWATRWSTNGVVQRWRRRRASRSTRRTLIDASPTAQSISCGGSSAIAGGWASNTCTANARCSPSIPTAPQPTGCSMRSASIFRERRAGAGIAAAVVLSTGLAAAQTDVYRAGTDLVVLQVSVSRFPSPAHTRTAGGELHGVR